MNKAWIIPPKLLQYLFQITRATMSIDPIYSRNKIYLYRFSPSKWNSIVMKSTITLQNFNFKLHLHMEKEKDKLGNRYTLSIQF